MGRKLIKSLRKFANPLDRLDLIKVDSNLTHIANEKLNGHIFDILSKLKQQFNDNLRLKDKRKTDKKLASKIDDDNEDKTLAEIKKEVSMEVEGDNKVAEVEKAEDDSKVDEGDKMSEPKNESVDGPKFKIRFGNSVDISVNAVWNDVSNLDNLHQFLNQHKFLINPENSEKILEKQLPFK